MSMPAIFKSATVPLFLFLALFSLQAYAEIDSKNLLDNVLDRYSAAASGWATTITNRASWLFWLLVVISMVWTFGLMALRRADLGEFFAEFLRFTIFTGFFWWLLINGPRFANSIIASLRQIGGEATGLGSSLGPSGIADIGFSIFFKVLDQSSVWTPVDSIAGLIIAGIILVILALIGVNMLLLLIAGWILAYSGIFFLGFGGSRWTSDMAISYYKTVLAIAAQLLAMVLLIGIGKTFLDDYYNRMSTGISLKEISVMLIASVILLRLMDKIPPMFAGIISGASVGSVGAGSFGSGMAFGAAGMAMMAASTGGAMMWAGAANMAGGASALIAAFQKAQENMVSSNNLFPGAGSSGSGSGLIHDGLAAAMGNPGRFLVDMGANLARGTGSVARDKAMRTMENFNQRVGETVGGKIASAIRNSDSFSGKPPGDKTSNQAQAEFDGDSLSAGQKADSTTTEVVSPNDEVAAFVNKKRSG